MPIAGADALASRRAAARTERCQRTVGRAYRSSTRRGRRFLILIAVLAAALAFSRQLIAPFLEAVIVGQPPTLPTDLAERPRAFLSLGRGLSLALLVVSILCLMASLRRGSGMIITDKGNPQPRPHHFSGPRPRPHCL